MAELLFRLLLIIAAWVTGPDLPAGLERADRFTSASEACLVLTQERARPEHRRAVYEYCEHRTYHSSRGGIVVSKIDGSQVHDRDRPFAWRSYGRGVYTGRISPETCEHHRVDATIPHPRSERELTRDWPFSRPKLTAILLGQWRGHPHDVERFGTRGPHDNSLTVAIRWLPGCYPPSVLDRYDASVGVTIDHGIGICEHWGCRTKWDLKEHWSKPIP